MKQEIKTPLQWLKI